MSCPSDWGFFERMTIGPADAVAVDLTNFRPLSATSISTTWPPAALDAADDTADETADDTAADTAVVADEDVPPDDPQPASATIARPARAAARFHLDVADMCEPFNRGLG